MDRHLERFVKPGMREFLESLRADVYFGNTGRSNNIQWVNVTERRLKLAGIYDFFKSIYYKPEGVDSDESKFWAIKSIKKQGYRVRHFDDNAYTVKQLAPHFPDDEFVIVEDLSSGILFSQGARRKQPNVSSIKLLF